jgi:lactate dehydrogenase-like 2-hydroxyacid dehydrogenase
MSEKSLAGISALGGFAWADVKDHLELIDRLSGSRSVRILVSEYVSINATVLEQAVGLKGVIACGAGFDHIDVNFAAKHRSDDPRGGRALI